VTDFQPPPSCWRVIGVSGDRSCPELARLAHCKNCPVFSAAARTLFDRPAPVDYGAGFVGAVAEPARPLPVGDSVLVFRLADEWLAIGVDHVCEIAQDRLVSRIAHRSRSLVAGLVNIRGQLHLCVALDRLLDTTDAADEPNGTAASTGPARLVVLACGHELWVFRADEVHGVTTFAASDLCEPPATLPTALAALTQGVVFWQGRSVVQLNGDGLFTALRKVAG
jgi:chemotaxis-related protein WspD